MDDFVIVGAGSAGCVLARRLCEHAKVTLIEAGPMDHRWDYRLHMPAALSQVLTSRWYNWRYHSEPEPGLNNRRLYCPRGKVMGGSSSINGMIFVRGNAADFDRWASEYGLADWDFDNCLPYFKRSEKLTFSASSLRGTSGPVPISRGTSKSPLFEAWLEAAGQSGHARTNDFNGEQQEGFGYFDRNIVDGVRQNIFRSYIDPIKNAKNLTLVDQANVTGVLLENGSAVGVDYVRSGKRQRCRAGQVLLCGGAINSPQLLMLSGIGDAAGTKRLDIDVNCHLPGVGRNLMDHLELYVQYACKQPVSVYPSTRWYRMPGVGLNWLLFKRGAGATNHFETGAFLKSDGGKLYPDLQFHFLPIAMDYDGKDQHRGHGFQVHVGPMKPTSRGAVKLLSSNPNDSPQIQFNYNQTEEDRRVMRTGIRMAQEIISQTAFDDYRGLQLRPIEAMDDKQLDEFVRQYSESAYHPCGTCKMGQGEESVVDSSARVHGIDKLRVIDASIMPEITNGNLNAPVLMMAEKISQSILDGE